MRLWLTVWEDRAGNKNYRFATTLAQVRVATQALKHADDQTVILRVGEIDVPTDNAGLAHFLNEFELAVGVKFDEVA
jgi:hypothetical protein